MKERIKMYNETSGLVYSTVIKQKTHMRTNQILIFCFVFFAALSTTTGNEQNDGMEFYSWYDGWGTHTIWGLGKLASSFSNATIVCGAMKVRVTPIYDSHASHEPPKPEQTSKHAENHNTKLVEELKNKNITCIIKE